MSTATPSSAEAQSLTWPDFFRARKARRRFELFTTIPATLIAGIGGGTYFFSLEGDSNKPIMGIDPLYVYAIAGVGCTGLGYLLGPSIGSSMWRFMHRARLQVLDARERELHRRIVKYRVPPELTPANNPRLPDFYGEKIESLQGYRKWLREQSRYKQKMRWGDIEDDA
ncbi:mitochondrial import protein Pam17 [Exidia glandulosa HHB12029]|uniref:Presequence translocated-associated motor subunit PAM17 n=1 Tax=Exidia glandulosa HHB12029 TaxID=1314781 RepID=A0A166AY98_EXIGL|nr:mitochondrial import protein Pam17 [Exidia glandulosa HHB12029]